MASVAESDARRASNMIDSKVCMTADTGVAEMETTKEDERDAFNMFANKICSTADAARTDISTVTDYIPGTGLARLVVTVDGITHTSSVGKVEIIKEVKTKIRKHSDRCVLPGEVKSVKDNMMDKQYTSSIDGCLMDERHRNLMKTKMIISFLFRRLYDITFANRWGHFTDYVMTRIIHEYGYWVTYHSGNGLIQVSSERISAMALSKDECYLYTGDMNGRIFQISLIDDIEMSQWRANKRAVRALASYNGYVISGGQDCLIHIWSTMNHRSLAGHAGYVNSLAISLDGKLIVSGSEDTTVRVWCFDTGLLLKEFESPNDSVSCVRYIGNTIISGSFDGNMKIFTDVEKESVCMPGDAVTYIASNSCLIACILLKEIVIFKWPELTKMQRMKHAVHCASFHPFKDNLLAVATFSDHSVIILDVINDNHMELCKLDSRIRAINFTYDGNRLMIATSNQIRYIDMSLISIDHD